MEDNWEMVVPTAGVVEGPWELDMSAPTASGSMGADPFDWLEWVPSESIIGMELSLVLYCMYRATNQFGKFINDMPHSEDDHVHEGCCFKCVLKALQLRFRSAANEEEYLKYFVRTVCKWYTESGGENIFKTICDSIAAWAMTHQEDNFDDYFKSLFRFNADIKLGCYTCDGRHFSLRNSQYFFDAEWKEINFFMYQLTTEISSLCSFCGDNTGYNFVSLRRLPYCLVFCNAGVPLLKMKYEEVEYKLSLVVPAVRDLKVYVRLQNGWTEIDFKKCTCVVKPFSTRNSWTKLEYIFYTRVD